MNNIKNIVLAALAALLIGLIAGGFIGYNGKKCPVPDISKLQTQYDSVSIGLRNALIAKQDAETRAAFIEEQLNETRSKRKPTSTRVKDAYSDLSSASVDSLAGVLGADPE